MNLIKNLSMLLKCNYDPFVIVVVFFTNHFDFSIFFSGDSLEFSIDAFEQKSNYSLSSTTGIFKN